MKLQSRNAFECVLRVGTVLVVFTITVLGFQNTPAQPTNIKTRIPDLLADWELATFRSTLPLDEARKRVETYRPGLPQRDPFTSLVLLTCEQRLARNEKVVWEDDDNLMAIVDFGDRGSKLLVVPKHEKNFPTDLDETLMPYVNKVAAATCDALMVAAGKQAGTTTPSCRMYINPPASLGVRQMHVHVQAQAGVTSPVDNTFLKRTAAHLRSLVGGRGCF